MSTNIKNGGTYPWKQSLVGATSLHQFLWPMQKKAALEFVDHVTKTRLRWDFEVPDGVSRTLWLLAGQSPIVWQYFPPARSQQPVIYLCVYRDVEIKKRTIPAGGPFARFWIEREPPTVNGYRVPSMDSFGSGPKTPNYKREHPTHHGNPRSFEDTASKFFTHDLIDFTPRVVILRVQHRSLMPTFQEPSRIPLSIGSPYLLVPGKEQTMTPIDSDTIEKAVATSRSLANYSARPEFEREVSLVVYPHPGGLLIRNLANGFDVRLDIKNPERPAAYAAGIRAAGMANVMWFHHSDNISLSVQIKKSAYRKGLLVYRYKGMRGYADKWPVSLVPENDHFLPYNREEFEAYTLEDPALKRLKLVARIVVELAIDVVPVVGLLYNFGQIAYIAATGKDFWGEKVSQNELILYGAFSSFSLAFAASDTLGRLPVEAARAADGTVVDSLRATVRQSDAYSEALKSGDKKKLVEYAGDSILLKELGTLDERSRLKILGQFENAINAKIPMDELVKKLGTLVERELQANSKLLAGKRNQDILDEFNDRRVRDLFSPDMRSFTSPLLHLQYQEYRMGHIKSVRGKRGQTVHAVEDRLMEPTRWVQDKRVSGWVKSYLKARLGPDYEQVLKEAIEGRGAVPSTRTLSKKHIDLYDAMVEKGVTNYGTLVAMRDKKEDAKFFGQFFQFDHIIEQRFIAKYVDVTDELSEIRTFQSFVVPRSEAVAFEMLRLYGGLQIRYVHTSKTTMLRHLIEHGAEHLYSVQEIADATLYTLKSLDAHQYIDLRYLETDFTILAEARKVPPPKLRPLRELNESLFDTTKGWPQVEKVNGVWTRTN